MQLNATGWIESQFCRGNQKLVAIYRYRDGAGKLLYGRFRLESTDGEKMIRPFFVEANGSENLSFKLGEPPFPNGLKPLYNLPLLRRKGDVWLVEGEKCADHAEQEHGLIALTAGASSAVAQADWKSLKGRHIIIWPDHDEPGVKSTMQIVQRLAGIAKSIKVVDVNRLGLDKGGDIVDFSGDVASVPLLDMAKTSGAAVAAALLPTTDVSNVYRIMAAEIGNILYAKDLGWYNWAESHWSDNKKSQVELKAQHVMERIPNEAKRYEDKDIKAKIITWGKTSRSAAKIEAAIKLLRYQSGIACIASEFDRLPHLFNCANGTLDLVSGDLKVHNRNEKITKVSPIKYEPEAECHHWLSFLDETFGADDALINYVQRALGYSLWGDSREHCLFFLYGTGRNGKSTLIKVAEHVFGTYSTTCSADVFRAKFAGSASPDLAVLRCARLISMAETDAEAKFSESLLKQLTSGDQISARMLYGSQFQMRIDGTFWIHGNHQPQLKGTDDGLWSRIRQVPFEHQMEKEHINKQLADELIKEEAPGILAWIVRGCADWRENGLGEPESVQIATSDYRQSMDIKGLFFEEVVEITPQGEIGSSILYRCYKGWCENSGYRYDNQRIFGQYLTSRGIERVRRGAGMVYVGLRIPDQSDSDRLNDKRGD